MKNTSFKEVTSYIQPTKMSRGPRVNQQRGRRGLGLTGNTSFKTYEKKQEVKESFFFILMSPRKQEFKQSLLYLQFLFYVFLLETLTDVDKVFT